MTTDRASSETVTPPKNAGNYMDDLHPLRIFVIENDPFSGELIEEVLKAEGHSVASNTSAVYSLSGIRRKPQLRAGRPANGRDGRIGVVSRITKDERASCHKDDFRIIPFRRTMERALRRGRRRRIHHQAERCDHTCSDDRIDRPLGRVLIVTIHETKNHDG